MARILVSDRAQRVFDRAQRLLERAQRVLTDFNKSAIGC
jgi:hypothetical protein